MCLTAISAEKADEDLHESRREPGAKPARISSISRGCRGRWSTAPAASICGTQDGRRYIDGSSGAVNVNIGHGNRAVIDAMKRQMDRVSFAYTIHFENEPANELARDLAERLPEGLERIYFVSGGSEAVEAAIKLARQWAVATGQDKRWKVIGRMPSYHGITLGALEPTGDDVLTKTFEPMSRPMPTDPGALRPSRPRQSFARRARRCDMPTCWRRKSWRRGRTACSPSSWSRSAARRPPRSSPPDSYYPRIREICDRYGILLIHDEVMSGIGRTGKFLGGDHWNCRPDIVVAVEGLSAPAMRRSARSPRRRRSSGRSSTMGGFLHGHTYGGNPVSCAAGLAVLQEIDRLGLIENAAAMGEVLKGELREPVAALSVRRRCARQRPAAWREIYADPVAKKPLPREANRPMCG